MNIHLYSIYKMIKCALFLLIIATCIVGIFADDFCEKQRKLDSECSKYCYQVAKPLLQMAPVCHQKDAEIANLQKELVVYKQQENKSKEEENKYNVLYNKFIELNKKLAVYEERDRKSLEEGTKCNELNTKLDDLQDTLVAYGERERKSKEENEYNKLNDNFIELHKKLGACEERDRKSLEEGNKYNELNDKFNELNKKLAVCEYRESKGFEEGTKCNELNATLAQLPKILSNLEERVKKGIEEKKSKEINSKAESKSKASLEEYRVKLSKLGSSNLALSMSNQEVKENLKQCNNYKWAYKNTCLKSWPGVDTTGSVEIEEMDAFSVRCVNDLNSGPGWMLIQKRTETYYYFNQDWFTFRDGFGNINGDFFIGLEKLYRLTNAEPHELYIDMKYWNGTKTFAHYDNFRVGNESEQYPLKDLGNLTSDSNAGDALRDNNNMKFSTKNRDNDNSPDVDCAEMYHSAWWHNNCTKANLNGNQYARNEYYENGIWWHSHVALKNVRMLIRPKVKK